MSYQEIFESLGFRYIGPCSCRMATGFIYRAPHREGLELWIYPKAKKVKRREYDKTVRMLGFNQENMESVIKELAA